LLAAIFLANAKLVRACFNAIGSLMWNGKPIFTARRMTLFLGFAFVSLISFYVVQGLL
jgi:hypothetical protein